MPVAHPDEFSLQRLAPAPAALVFSVRTFLAAMTALYVAFALGLERPAWAMATVYIVSQPISGAALAKGSYRLLGTLIGGVFTLMIVPVLVDAPVLLTLALSLWIGACLYLSLRDRTPRSYVFMLAGYSAAIIGFPNVGDPIGLFGIVVARVQEIGLGIVCATVFSALLLPQTAHAAGLARIVFWLRAADAQAAGLLRGTLERAQMAQGERALAADLTGLQALMIYLGYEPSVSRVDRALLRAIHERMVLMLRLLAEIRDRLVALRAEGPLAPEIDALLARLADWTQAEVRSDPQEGAACAAALARMAARARDISGPQGGQDSWRAATLINLTLRLRRAIDAREDCRTLWQALADERMPAPGALRIPPAGGLSRLGAIDPANALRAALALVLALWITAAFWILTAWPDGATAMMMVAICASVTAAQRTPIPAVMEFILAALIALVFVFVYLFAILPFVTDFGALCLALFPALLVCGVLVAIPRTVALGFGITVTFTTLLGLQNSFSSDLVAFANGNSAAVLGMCIALACIALVRPRSAAQAAARLVRHGFADVAALARLPQTGERERMVRRLLDRLGLLAPSLPRRGDDGETAFATLFAAEGVLGLAALAPFVSAAARSDYEHLLRDVGSHFDRLYAGDRPAPDALLGRIDRIGAEIAASPGARAEAAVSALVSLRRGLLLEREHVRLAT